MALSIDTAFGIHEHALKLRGQRTEILASNLANADTPNYKARDIDFQSALKHAMSGQQPMSLSRTHQSHIKGMAGSLIEEDMKYRVPNQPALDGNTVETHIEQGIFTRNAIEYQASLKFLEGKAKGLMHAIKGSE